MSDDIWHRAFGLCVACGRDIARWEDNPGGRWWHLDSYFAPDHPAALADPTDPEPEGGRR